MTRRSTTGTTGTNRDHTGTRTQQEPTGTTGTTGLLEVPVSRVPVPRPHGSYRDHLPTGTITDTAAPMGPTASTPRRTRR